MLVLFCMIFNDIIKNLEVHSNSISDTVCNVSYETRRRLLYSEIIVLKYWKIWQFSKNRTWLLTTCVTFRHSVISSKVMSVKNSVIFIYIYLITEKLLQRTLQSKAHILNRHLIIPNTYILIRPTFLRPRNNFYGPLVSSIQRF